MEEVVRFLQHYPPFDQLAPARLADAAAAMQIEYFAAGQTILAHGGAPAEFLYIVCKGSVDLLREEHGHEEIFDSLGPGEVFGHLSIIRARPPIVTARAATETLAYLLPAAVFLRLRDEDPDFARFFAAPAVERITFALEQRHADAAPSLFQTRVGDLLRRPIVAISPDATVRQAAERMRAEHVSCLLVDLPPYGVFDKDSGIVTDRDLRNRVVADGLPETTLVRDVMSAPVLSLPMESLVFEALLLMLERGIHHLPITHNDLVVGMVTHTDILRHQSRSPLFLPRQLDRARTLDDLRQYADQVAETVGQLVDIGARVGDIGRIVAIAHDALLQRILRDIESELGPPPVPYAFLVLGSGGRYEQTLRTDQDHALVYADQASPAAEAYFAALAELAVERLEYCGFPRCPGNVMATNPEWRRPLSDWIGYFTRWIDVPDEEALLRTGIFFDFRQVFGTLDAATPLRATIARARGNTLFLTRLARAALRQPAPLNMFRKVTLERRGEQKHLLDLKHRGTAMVVDLARLFALEAGRSETSTIARLRNAWPASSIGESEAERLIAAFELLSLLRLGHQLEQIARGEEPGNLIVYPQLSPHEQRELKESLQAIASVQRAAALAFQTDRIVT
jgi:CBS domain-containing protein